MTMSTCCLDDDDNGILRAEDGGAASVRLLFMTYTVPPFSCEEFIFSTFEGISVLAGWLV